MRSKRTVIIIAAALAAALIAVLAATRRSTPQPKPAQASTGSQPGQCPKLDGSQFGADNGQITKGEAVSFAWKLPREYVNINLRVEQSDGGEGSNLPFNFATFYDAENPPPVIESSIPDVRPERTTRYVLKATGPEGCQPLELPATVAVIEPEGEQPAPTEGECPDAQSSKFDAAPVTGKTDVVRLSWDVPNAERIEAANYGTEVRRGSLNVELTNRQPDSKGLNGQPAYRFTMKARKQGCAPVTKTTIYAVLR